MAKPVIEAPKLSPDAIQRLKDGRDLMSQFQEILNDAKRAGLDVSSQQTDLDSQKLRVEGVLNVYGG